MTQLMVKSNRPDSIVSLIKWAIEGEVSGLKIGIEKTRESLKEFEKKYKMSSEKFYNKFQKGEMGDDFFYLEWAGEYELLPKLLQDYQELKETQICI